MSGPHYFAWCDEGTAFGPAVQVEDEAIFDLEIAQAEGDFPALTIEVANPRLGLLGPGRHQWCWVSWDNGAEIVPLFHGRLVGVPENLTDEVVRLLFRARPSDYPARKEAVAAPLRVLPFWDPIWLQDRVEDPDTVLETRNALWHIDRLTLAVTISDNLQGEDGTIDVSADEHFYDGVSVSYTGQPLRRIKVTLTGSWTQRGAGEVDLTQRLVAAFRAAGSPYPAPMVSSYTAEGLLGDWPKPEANLGGGWAMAPGSSAARAIWVQPGAYAVRYTDRSDSTQVKGFAEFHAESDSFGNFVVRGVGPEQIFFINWKNFDVVFELAPIVTSFVVTYAAERKRSEIASFTVSSSVQSILSDPGAAEEDTIDLGSDVIDQPVDPDGALPIGDARRNLYFPTDRGQMSLQFGMLVARAKLLSSARAVDITFQTIWQKLVAEVASCRKSILLHDDRLPGGQALGKIKSYRLMASGAGGMLAEATIGCCIGYGVALDAAAGEDTYATDYATGYTASSGGEEAIIPGELHYASLDGTYVADDDGIDLFAMTPQKVINSIVVTGGPNQQRWAIDASLTLVPVDFRLNTLGDIVSATSIANLQDVTGLETGTTYAIAGLGIHSAFTTGDATLFTFDGGSGGTLSRAAAIRNRVPLMIASTRGAVLTPDPVGALGKTPTIVQIDLVPVTNDDFLTEYAVDVRDLVVPIGIDLEAA